MEKLRLLLPINSKARERKFALALDAFARVEKGRARCPDEPVNSSTVK